jgi:hypothetical protein
MGGKPAVLFREFIPEAHQTIATGRSIDTMSAVAMTFIEIKSREEETRP